MITKALKVTICDYLKGFKARMVAQAGLHLAHRKQCLDSLALLGLTVADLESAVLELTEENYSEGPKHTRGIDCAGVWFMTDFENGRRAYVELMIDAHFAKCLSLHPAGRLRAANKKLGA
jgi:hypothetical protein